MGKNNLILLFSGIALGVFLVFVPKAILIPLIFVLLALIIGIFLIYSQEPDNPKTLLKIFILGLTLRLVICSILAAVSYIKNGHVNFLYADDWGFNVNALDLLRVWKVTGQAYKGALWWMFIAGDITYPRWLSYLYYFIGIHTLAPSFINCSLGALSIIFVYLISKQIYNHKVAVWASLLFTFWPSVFLWSTQNLKETLTTFIILYVFWFVLKLKRNAKSIIPWVFLLISLYVIYNINIYIYIILLFSMVFSVIPALFGKTIKYFIILAIVMFLFFAYERFGAYDFIRKYIGVGLPEKFSILDKLNQVHNLRAYSAESAFLVGLDFSKPLNFIIYLPALVSYILFAPFPWNVFKPAQLLAALEMSIWLILFLPALRGILATIKGVRKGNITLIFLMLMLIVSLAEGNIGTLFRHRSFIWPCWHIFIAAGLFYRIQKPVKA